MVKPCSVCGTEKGAFNPRTRIPIRNAAGWCLACTSRKGKPRIIEPCVDCGDPAGQKQTKDGNTFVIRVLGRCGKCSGRYYRIQAKNAKIDRNQIKAYAKPCFNCGTTGGYTDSRNGKILRIHGLCKACYRRLGPEESKRIEHQVRFQSMNKDGPVGANNPPCVDLIREWSEEIKVKALGHIIVPDLPFIKRPKATQLTEQQKRERSRSWVKEILAAERALSRLVRQWAIRETKTEAGLEAQQFSLPPALLSA